MKKNLILLAVLLCFLALAPQSALASNAVGIDGIRLIDKNQDDGMTNAFFQHALSRTTAVKAGFASGDDLTIIEVSYKGYNQRYYNGTFYELGGAYVDDSDDSEIGFTASLGYETSIANSLVVGGAVQMMLIDEDIMRQEESPIFLPRLYAMFTF
ncbi:hypothetical protein [Desulfurispira natronophila]|uniref:Opacity protein-like surface antigen n=1 Tax=Desulfurispira natronophila TaxID=682562 RepID=A0A7W8DGB0_9BACT|nr:hypothetical protein [Desulfurispira natronophila]MBB5021048.1 opacity protein-like surface antigen [Desulfurispira natronophila]